jgi:hypothetical protein
VARFNGHGFAASTSLVPYITAATCLPSTCIGVGTQGVGPARRTLGGVVYRFH